jgi:uncharacterized protein (DUF433 family)
MSVEQPSTTEWITSSPTVIDGKPRVKGTRLGVHFLATQVVDDDCSASDVSARYNIPVEAVEAAVEYYDNHPELMNSIERQQESLFEEAERNPRVPTTPEELATFATESRSSSD